MPDRPIRVLFNTWANRDNTNSQSLTAREIASRLNKRYFISSLFIGWNQEPDPKLSADASVRLLRLPPRLGTLYITYELLWGGHDIVAYPALNSRSSRLFRACRRLGKARKVVDSVETSLDQIAACGETAEAAIFSSLQQADVRTAITPAISRDLKARLHLESLVVPLGVDLSLFQPVDRTDRKRPWKVLYVASIQPRKQTHLILDFARTLPSEQVEFHCIGPCLGNEAYLHDLLSQKERDKLDHVIFHGSLSQPEIYEHMKSADLYVLPSRLEGFGKTTLEAAASGLPSIVFSDYETTAVLDKVTGFQVKTNDEMLAAIHLLLDDPVLRQRLGQAASEHAQNFSWGPIAMQWEKIFTEIMQAGKTSRL